MEMQMLDYMGKFMSCTVSIFIMFRYFDTKYERRYESRLLYAAIKILCLSANYMLYMIDNPVVNMVFWLVMTLFVGGTLYYDNHIGRIKGFIINYVFVLSNAICEAVGVMLVNAANYFLHLNPDKYTFSFVRTVAGSAACVLLYYLVLKRIFTQKKAVRIFIVQYLIYAVAAVYVLVSIGEILVLGTRKTDGIAFRFMILNAFFGIFLNLYLFYLLDAFAENKELKYRITLYEKQEKLNYEYYTKQADNYKTALSVLHDIRKHAKVLRELDQKEKLLEVQSYANAFENMLSPLLLKQYCRNVIFNIIINDKEDFCAKNNIDFEVEVRDIDIDFMEPIDITTIFGNLLDNAVEACTGMEKGHIVLEAGSFNGLIYVQLSNSFSGKLRWDSRGFPLSNKGEQHGIGLKNAEKILKKYNGSMEFSAVEDMFTVKILLSGCKDPC